MYPLLVMTISGSVIALLLMVLRYTVLRKMPSTVYYYAWLLVLLRFALPLPGFVPTSGETANEMPAPSEPAVYSEVNTQENVQEYAQENVFEYVQDNARQVPEFDYSDEAKTDTAISDAAPVATETQAVKVSETAPKAELSIDWKSPALWLSVWAAGAVVSFGITVFSYFQFDFRLKKRLMEPDNFTKAVYDSIPGRKPALYYSYSVRTPMLLGVFKPKIILPYRGYNEELLLNILRHELTHYRRFDTLYKWVSAVILSLHWFNPVAWVIRKEFNRACELSCDEMLLRSMDKYEKQSYGNSLLLMAAQSPLPSAVVATSFANDKKNLKERLVQIMNYKKSGVRLLSTVLAVALLTGCSVAAGPLSGKPSEEEEPAPVTTEVSETDPSFSVAETDNEPEIQVFAPEAENGVVKVKNVDEFLVSIAPHTVIELAEGVYDLTQAFDYGKTSKSEYYSWNGEVDSEGNGAELVIHDVKDLTIRGAGMGKTSIVAVDRSACVINFSGCKNLSVSNLTAGHTVLPDPCNSAVLYIANCPDSNIESCGLYGCGTIGIDICSCENVNITECDIYECSVSAVKATYCEDILISGCDIHDHGTRFANSVAYHLFDVINCTDISVSHCNIHDNRIDGMLYTSNSDKVYFLSNEVTKNKVKESVFDFDKKCTAVDGCHFEDNEIKGWYKKSSTIPATDLDGNELASEQFKAMEYRDINPETSNDVFPTQPAMDVAPGTEINVTTVDEFLEAIGPDRTIVLDGENFDLSKAKDYGGTGTAFYGWNSVPDGYELSIRDVQNLTIKAKNPDPAATTLEALPRYANVLSFQDCYYITVEGFTAGHTKEKGACAGGVLSFNETDKIKVEKMRLYGCGDLGILTYMCSDIDIINTEIYECSSGATYFSWTKGINFKDCDIHDVPSPAHIFDACTNIVWNGQKLEGSYLTYDVKADGSLVSVVT